MKVMYSITAAAVFALSGSSALAQEAKTGLITQIDRLNSTISIQPTQDGTVGSSGGAGAATRYKVQGSTLEDLHAGDQVSFSAAQNEGVDTITKIEKKKSNVVK
jgi:Cu/Ag efflux protein CusF